MALSVQIGDDRIAAELVKEAVGAFLLIRDRDGLIDQSEADVVLPTIQSLLQLPCVQQCICN